MNLREKFNKALPDIERLGKWFVVTGIIGGSSLKFWDWRQGRKAIEAGRELSSARVQEVVTDTDKRIQQELGAIPVRVEVQKDGKWVPLIESKSQSQTLKR